MPAPSDSASPRPLSTRRVRLAAAWIASAVVIGGYYLLAGGEDEDDGRLPPAVVTSADQEGKLDVLGVAPGEPTPGSALQIRYSGGGNGSGGPLRAFVGVPEADGTRTLELEVLERRPQSDELVVRLPKSVGAGRHKVRLQRGDDRETRSKPFDLRIKAINRQKVFRSVMGGLALLVFGLRTMSRGSRGYTGQRSHGLVAAVARRRTTAVALGVVVGGITQFTTTAAGLMVGLIESHLVGAAAATAVLLGAQLGAAAAPSVLGLTSTAREGLLLVTVGVVWLTLAADRRGQALGKIILGCGLLFYGLHLLRIGFEPLVSNPEILPYIDRFHADRLSGLGICVGTGVLLSALLQGPAPVFALVLGLTQVSVRIDLQSALAILAGTGLGASIGAAVVAWPFGAEPRRMARLYFLAALLGTLFLAATVNLWAFLADELVASHSQEIAYGKKILLPHIGKHLVAGFAISQLAATTLVALALPLLVKATRSARAATPVTLDGAAGVTALRTGLARVLGLHLDALRALLDLSLTGHRKRGGASEHCLADARSELEALFGGAVRTRENHPELARLRQAALSTLQLQRSMEDLLRHAERTTERAIAISAVGEAWEMGAPAARTVRALHALLVEGIEALRAQLDGNLSPDVDAARTREIRMNALEGETRQALLAAADNEPRALAHRLISTDLVNAYEAVGNQLYRLHEALAAEIEQDAAE
jgi:Na+/phosphate symporter